MLPKTTNWCVRGLGRNADIGEKTGSNGKNLGQGLSCSWGQHGNWCHWLKASHSRLICDLVRRPSPSGAGAGGCSGLAWRRERRYLMQVLQMFSGV